MRVITSQKEDMIELLKMCAKENGQFVTSTLQRKNEIMKMIKKLQLTIKAPIIFHQFIFHKIYLDDSALFFIDDLETCLSHTFGFNKICEIFDSDKLVVIGDENTKIDDLKTFNGELKSVGKLYNDKRIFGLISTKEDGV